MKQSPNGDAYSLVRLTDEETARWDDLIVKYETCELFHRRAWFDYLVDGQGVVPAFWAIRSASQTVGYFCGGLLRKGPFRILGSPLRTWGTNFMGPLVNRDVDQATLVGGLDALARDEALDMIELEHPLLSEPALETAGFIATPYWTYLVELAPEGPDAMWRRLDSTARNRIRHAQRAQLVIQEPRDEAIADEYYDQYSALMHRKGLVPPFGREVPRLLVKHLLSADALLALRVCDVDGRLLAVGLFPHDDRTIYFWGGASVAEGHPLCPNDFLHWSAMVLAAKRGLRVYNMCGHGRFKKKFGGTLTLVRRWHKSYSRTASWGRAGYELWFQKRMAWQGRWRTIVHPVARESAEVVVATEAAAPSGSASRKTASLPLRSLGRRQRPSFRWSDIWKAPQHDFPIRDEILYQYLSLTPDMEVLEIGPGSGFTAYRLARHLHHLTLLDVAAGNSESLRARLGDLSNLRFVCADAAHPELSRRLQTRFDAAYALEVFEYIPDSATCLRNVATLLRPGGQFLFQFPNYARPDQPELTYFESRAALDELLAAAPFTTWAVYALRLRPWAAFIIRHFAEPPLRLYRRWADRHAQHDRAMTYDETWAFQHGHRLEPLTPLMHTAWTVLSGAMRLGGDAFRRTLLRDDIVNRNLLVVARR